MHECSAWVTALEDWHIPARSRQTAGYFPGAGFGGETVNAGRMSTLTSPDMSEEPEVGLQHRQDRVKGERARVRKAAAATGAGWSSDGVWGRGRRVGIGRSGNTGRGQPD
jgi:hypothetical protein